VLAGIALTAFLDGPCILSKLCVAEVDASCRREHSPVSPQSAGQHAIKDVDAPCDAFHQVLGCAHSHEIAGLSLWQERCERIQNAQGICLALTHGKAADGIPLKVHLRQKAGALGAQVLKDATLHDAKQGLVTPRVSSQAAFRPQVRAAHGLLHIVSVVWHGTLVEHHGYIRAKHLLYLDNLLRRQPMLRPVNVRAKGHARLVYAAEPLQGEHLKATTIGQDRTRPGHEAVQAPQALDQVRTRTQVKMVGVTEDHRRAQLGQIPRGEALDGGLRSHGAKHRRGDKPMGGKQGTTPSSR